MKRIVIGLMVSTVAVSTFAECSYNFDANQTQISAMSSGSSVFPNINGQKVSLTFQPSNEFKTYLAVSSGFANNKITQPSKYIGDIALNQSNVIAYEILFKAPNIVLTSDSMTMLFPGGLGATKNGQIVLSNMIINVNNVPSLPNQILSAWQVLDTINNNIIGENSIDNNLISNSLRLGFYINQQTQQVGVIVDGVNQGYVGTFSEKPDQGYFNVNFGVKNIPENSPIVGKEFSFELITDHSKMQFNYPTGAKDICGNAI
ncbi:DUF4882 family protein [Acinetobacter guerrae]|uniref:DUF4882 family protein n=1 Tax=Acinetobacter guerrae TaxID=1843371 RepID=UPI00125F6347|nr:DUF4882 family protein [Acinetobacter guerrae]